MIKIQCYKKITKHKEEERKKLINEYMMAIMCCDGSERERYMNILLDLISGFNECKDERGE